jgi:hypothetical protein
VTALRNAAQAVVDAGALAARVASVEDTHLILLDFRSPEDADRVSREVGGPLMRDRIVPPLARDSDRSVGHVIVSARA